MRDQLFGILFSKHVGCSNAPFHSGDPRRLFAPWFGAGAALRPSLFDKFTELTLA